MTSTFIPNQETDYIPTNILLTGGAGTLIYIMVIRLSSRKRINSALGIELKILYLCTLLAYELIVSLHTYYTLKGFIGSHAAILLAKKYPHYKVVVYDKLDYCSCLANLGEIARLKNFKFVKGDISSPDLVS